MVVALDDETKNAKLSLRQTEILAKLSSIVNDISLETADSCVEPSLGASISIYIGSASRYLLFIRNMDATCWNLLLVRLLLDQLQIYLQSRRTCVIGRL